MPHSWSRPKTEADQPEYALLQGIAGRLVLHDDYKPKVSEEVQRVEEGNLAHLAEEDLHSDFHKPEEVGKAELKLSELKFKE